MPFAYWVSKQFINNFNNAKTIEDYGIFTGSQNITGDNERFLRFFWEVSSNGILSRDWVLYAKGGDYRQYYGNLIFVVNWTESARKFYATNKTSNLLMEDLWFKEGITYSAVTSRGTGFRFLPPGCIFDKGGPSICINHNIIPEIIALFNSNVAKLYFWVFNPSINLQVRDVKSFPIILSDNKAPNEKSIQNIKLSKIDWDSFETSWDFRRHPLVRGVATVREAYEAWAAECEERFQTLKANEEELNRIFIDIYGLQDELTPEVEDRDVTVRRADLGRDVRSFVSYAVGCMFGRYSLDTPGLAFAGGDFDSVYKLEPDVLVTEHGNPIVIGGLTILSGSSYKAININGEWSPVSFEPDKDNCLPITDEEYFEDDIVARFVDFVRVVFGEETLEENLDYIAKALGNRGSTSREVVRNYFLNDFMTDHLKIYQKRPIYWMFDSGKQNGFKALVYMHRWNADTIGNVRVEYLHKTQRVYERELERMQEIIDNGKVNREIAQAQRRRDKLTRQLKETRDYDQRLAHLALLRIDIDLDDGVKVNYNKVQTADGKNMEILAKIR